ncbi:MAG: hypothetical protein H6Q16_1913 [Bacteroidetes bacterium]|nr:hypothetical protein [Bacteroidota bacterium]
MKNTLRIIFGLTILISVFSFVSCQEIVDTDVITGKWMDKKILNLPDSTTAPCIKKSYIEFSDYKIDMDKRTVNQYYACDYTINENGDTIEQVPYTELLGYYTIIEDTLKILFVKDYTTKVYNIKNINDIDMHLTTLDQNGDKVDLYYKRFNE